ncbi:uncharacterized protein MONOS_8830 [Monocercomonoides exilis]|uniref:uncharacterized protein n=1 Tax=Monocercomonoides exilis TaxID=2049356 RepID=UPI00355AB01D|nr:hypothetical protein MONOS_8830 [Monocercomonoides exilis]|eukprot:MONOS_8830.1-p1 / transcript=MONOS_8830.1 / gene=MONOS_8830 / organism=Monocercomonoides_exilis_PA203 / gene_product=unspecified product / transcript_product=unspecified product / location=Mono_scaffold00344:27141-27542(+) / protein_length=134 / sequence_SO=supercontig / SO=protein_coding / is_pseudo=false
MWVIAFSPLSLRMSSKPQTINCSTGNAQRSEGGTSIDRKALQTTLTHSSIAFCCFTLNERPKLCLMDGRLVGEREKEEEEEEEEGDGDDGDEMRNEEEVNKDDLYADENVEKVIAFDNMLLNPSWIFDFWLIS